MLRKIKNIYARFLKKKKLYYFLNYYKIVSTLKAIELNPKLIEYFANSTMPFVKRKDIAQNNLTLSNNNRYINSYSKHFSSNYNKLIPNSISGDSLSHLCKSERIPKKRRYNNSYNFKKIHRNLLNNFVNDNTMYKKSITTMSNKNLTEKGGKKRRNLSYGSLEIKRNKENETFKMFTNINNNEIYNDSNSINNTQSLKTIFPSYTITSPNGLLYPIIFTNSNENLISNNNLNNNIFFNYQENTTNDSNDPCRLKPKPSLWYANVFSPIGQIPIVQNNNYTISKYLNNSANFNSIPNLSNNYSEDYLNNQIFGFINANSATKQNIISNISKKHNIKLTKSNVPIKNNEINNKINYNNNIQNHNNLSKSMNKKTKSLYTINVNNSNPFFSEREAIEKEDNISKDKSFDKPDKKININKLSWNNDREVNNISNLIINNNMNSQRNFLINKHNNENQISNYENSYNNEKNMKNNIYNLKNQYSNSNKRKMNNPQISNEYQQKLEKQQEYSYNTEKMNNKNNNNFQYNNHNNNNNDNNFNNEKEISGPNHNLYKGYNTNTNSNNYKISLSNNNAINNFNYNSLKINIKNNNMNNKKGMQIKNNMSKKDDINFNTKNIKKEILKQKIKYDNNQNISISTLTLNENSKPKVLLYPSKYEINNIVGKNIMNKKNNKKILKEKEEEQNISLENSLQMSLQSMNDSKILEMANHFVDEEKALDINQINDILNDKSCQKIMKQYK